MYSPQVLRRSDYFGQYGKIVKVVVNRNHSTSTGDSSSGGSSGNGSGSGNGSSSSSGNGGNGGNGGAQQTTSASSQQASASAYITFAHKEDAKACIGSVDGFTMDGRHMRASFGTTK